MFSARRIAGLLILGTGLMYIIFTKLLFNQNIEMASKLVGLEFEVFGRVQGIFGTVYQILVATSGFSPSQLKDYRVVDRFTQERGRKLGLTGWCRNTDRGTVFGYMEGDKPKIEEMKRWLQYTGSPQSQIEKAEFRDEKPIANVQFSDFKIKK